VVLTACSIGYEKRSNRFIVNYLFNRFNFIDVNWISTCPNEPRAEARDEM
jgi:hypothetical protein